LKGLKHILFFLFWGIVSVSFATHNRAGEITYRHISGFKYEITVVTYTDPNSPADRPELEVVWGDNTLDTIQRTNITAVSSIIQKNTYVSQHIYPGPGSYTISVLDPNRNAGSQNIPNSVNVPFFIQSRLLIDPFALTLGYNNSPQLLNPPIDNACLDKIYIHNPGAFDADGDSLAYSLVDCAGNNGSAIPGYLYPNQVNPGPGNNISLNPITGDFIWNSPKKQGEYNIAILISEYRGGKLIGTVLRDMQITVGICQHDPPDIQDIADICVIANDTLIFNVNASNPTDPQDKLKLTANGGPLVLTNSPAIFFPPTFNANSVTGTFYWETNCDHVRKQPYQVNFKAEDDNFPVLVDLETVQITVIAPPPTNLQTAPQGNAINVTWNKACNNAIGYKIYRKINYYGYTPAYCETGVPAYTGYSLIKTISGVNTTSYLDDNSGKGLVPGTAYCYMVTSYFSDNAESIASVEICDTLKKDVPLITHVDVDSTSTTLGKINVNWSKPTEHDTVANPGPYHYLIYRAENNFANFTLIDSTLTINDTTYVDSLLNTSQNYYVYRIDFYSTGNGYQLVGKSSVAQSIFLNITPADNQLTLSWNETVPWANSEYTIFRRNFATGVYDSLTTVTTKSYVDDSLANGIDYCYYVRSKGQYFTPGTTKPLFNRSQKTCKVPEDLEAPCPPTLAIVDSCSEQFNLLIWNNPNLSCADDVVSYKVYHHFGKEGEFKVIYSSSTDIDTVYQHGPLESIAGCYYVTAIDSFGNESVIKDTVCVDNCPYYVLPNVFTPGNDGKNDFFVPFPYRYIDSIDLTVFNRWGNVVFSTTDKDINWDGTNTETNKPCSDGVYFYICTVNEILLEGIVPRTIKGNVQLIRKQGSGK